MIVDAHCHLVPTREGVEYLLDTMAGAGISETIVVPGGLIPPNGMADYLRGKIGLAMPQPDNDFLRDTIHAYPGRISAFYHVVPSFDDADTLSHARADGFVGLKFSPVVDRCSFTDEGCRTAIEFAQQHGMPLYTHIVAHGGGSLEALDSVAREFPTATLILGHMGFASSDLSAIQLAFRHDNLFLETSVGSASAIREAYRVLGSTKLIFGSEGPTHHPAVELHKIRLLNLSDGEFDNICHRNIKHLLR